MHGAKTSGICTCKIQTPDLHGDAYPDALFDDVDLYTMDGKYVITGQINRTLVPNVPRYELIMWGGRTFVWDEEHQQYRETVGTAVLRTYVNTDPDR